MGLKRFLKDFKFFKKFKLSKDIGWKILDIIGYFLNVTYKLSMAIVPGIVCIYFVSPLFGLFVLLAGFYRMVLDMTNCNSIKEVYLSLRWSFKNK